MDASTWNAVPAELRLLPQWVVWQYADRDGKPTKLPIDAHTRRQASVTDRNTWATFDEAVAACLVGEYAGVGFVFAAGGGYIGFDIDHCRDAETGKIGEAARRYIERLGSYAEVSPSGTGVHVILRGALPSTGRRQDNYEMYASGRYFTVTGKVLEGYASVAGDQDVIDAVYRELFARDGVTSRAAKPKKSALSDDEVLRRAREREGGNDVDAILAGEWTKHWSSHSQADLAFCKLLAAVTEDDDQIDRIVRASPLMRKKWNERRPGSTYGRITIGVARDFVSDWDMEGKKIKTDSFRNVRTALRRLGVEIWYDAFEEVVRLPGRAMTDDDVIHWKRRIQEEYGWDPTTTHMYESVRNTARADIRHPILTYLDGLTWDTTPRVEHWLERYAGVAHDGYVAAIGTLLLVAAVRRVRAPGAKFDVVVILEGEQGIGKSSLLRILAVEDAWFSDSLRMSGTDDKGFIEDASGKWILESSELTAILDAEPDVLKARISRQTDRARLAYGRNVESRPRQCIIVGTTNSTAYLADLTGNRRFFPIRCGHIDLEALRRDRDQLWAEAVQVEATWGEKPLEIPRHLWPEAAAHAAERIQGDPWLDDLSAELGAKKGTIQARDVYTYLQVPPERRSTRVARRITGIMTALGWDRDTVWQGKGVGYVRLWVKGTPEERARKIIVLRRGVDDPNNQYTLCYDGEEI